MSKLIAFQVDDALHDYAKKKAAEKEMSLSSLIRICLKKGLMFGEK